MRPNPALEKWKSKLLKEQIEAITDYTSTRGTVIHFLALQEYETEFAYQETSPDDEIDKALVQCSYYRYTFLAAGAEVEARLSRIERKYLIWFATVSEIARKEIMQERLEYKQEHSVPGSWFGSITKLEIEQRIATDPSTSKKY